GRAGDCRFRVAVLVADEDEVRIEAGLEKLSNRGAGHFGIRSFIPDDWKGVERALGLPPGIGNNGDSGFADLHDLLHALHSNDRSGVEAFYLAAEDRAVLDCRVEHAWQSEIDSIDQLAGELVGGVEALNPLAGNLPVLRILELHILRRLELGGGFRDLAVGDGAAGRGVREPAVRGAHLGARVFPLVGGGLLEHLPRRGAALAHVILRVADAAAAAGRHVAPYALAGDVLAGGGIFGRDLRPVAFEFLGDELGEPGKRALTHLRAGDANDHRVVRADHHPGVALGRAGLCANDPRAAERNIEAKRQTAAHGGRANHEAAAIDLRYVIHGCLPHALAAAAWIAARTCWKVPQRQILVMLAS